MIHRLTVLTALTIASISPAANALTLGKKQAGFRTLEGSRLNVHAHSFGTVLEHGNALYQSGKVALDQAVAMHLRGKLLNPIMQIRSKQITSGFGLLNNTNSFDYSFYVNGVPLCEYQVRAHELKDRSVFMLGQVPDIDPYDNGPTEWPDFTLSWENIVRSARSESGQNSIRLTHRSKCLITANQRLMAVWNVTVNAGGLNYHALADAYETISLRPGFFDFDGSAKVYPQNRLSGSPTSVSLKGLIGDGTLRSAYLKTVVPSGWTAAVETSHVFNYAPTDTRFEEAQAYANVQRHFDYFRGIGFEWYGPAPLEVRIHFKPQGRPNNALFQPGSESNGTFPSITIDDGDGIELQNLITDTDVVAHEFGHHVIFRTLQETSGESLVLHEGLADFFSFARTNDGCLGESICPNGSLACSVKNQCLRTAINSLKYEDSMWMHWAGSRYRLGHLHGQVISGLLWDLMKDGDIPASELPKLVYRAITYFQKSSGFRDLMLALFTADKELYAGQYGAKIKAAAEARNLTEFFSDVDLGKEIPKLSGTDGSGSLPMTGSEPEKKKDSGNDNPFSICGTIAGNTPSGSFIILLLALLLPLTLRLRAQPERVRVKAAPDRQPKNQGTKII